jgi:hypothetical protein
MKYKNKEKPLNIHYKKLHIIWQMSGITQLCCESTGSGSSDIVHSKGNKFQNQEFIWNQYILRKLSCEVQHCVLYICKGIWHEHIKLYFCNWPISTTHGIRKKGM